MHTDDFVKNFVILLCCAALRGDILPMGQLIPLALVDTVEFGLQSICVLNLLKIDSCKLCKIWVDNLT